MNPNRPGTFDDDFDPIDRRLELLGDRAIGGLDPVELTELADLTGPDDPDALALELAAASIALVGIEATGLAELPEGLAARLEREASRINPPKRTSIALVSAPTSPPRRRRIAIGAWAGWLAAAASIALVVVDRSGRDPVPQPPPQVGPSVATDPRDRLVSSPSSPMVATSHPLARGAGGSVVWDEARQEGMLRIKGLAPVDPKSGCYQLWVFDADRDGRYPVDGGVFTISTKEGDEGKVVDVRPRIKVHRPTMFAVTLEPPGGVVVSDRERILLTAEWTSKAVR